MGKKLLGVILFIKDLFVKVIYTKEFINILIDNSSLILLVLSTITLIVFSVLTVWLTYVYYLPEKLLARLEKQYRTAKNEQDKQTFFYAISSILFYSIKKEGEPLARELQEFYAREFINFRSNKSNTSIEYPDCFYDVMFYANVKEKVFLGIIAPFTITLLMSFNKHP